jgi:hypothetical protein
MLHAAAAIDELAPKISLYANRHDNVNTADFSANHPSSRELVHDRDLGGSSGETRSQD